MAKELGITGVKKAEDGHVYYLIGNADSSTFIARVRTISERNALTGNGIVLVTEAYKGDPTVNRGWALYLSIGSSTTTTSVRWLKIAEAETVDGIWGFQQEVLATLVKKPVFARHVEWDEAEHDIFRKAIEEWKTYSPHTHVNLEILNKISVKGGVLYYDGNQISSTYRYEPTIGEDGMLIWKNPLNDKEIVEGLTSNEIAVKFCKTALAKSGLSLQIKEADGSISSFIICSENGELTPIFAWTIGGNLSGFKKAITFTDKLPVASKNYVGKGYLYLLQPASCGNLAGHLFECVKISGEAEEYRWRDITEKYSQISSLGAEITVCRKLEWNKTIIAFKDPDDVKDGSTKFKTTYVVRKFGSAPNNRFDGVLICKEEYPNQYNGVNGNVLIDVCPLTHDDVFYGVFSEANSGASYSTYDKSFAEAKFIDWKDIANLLKLGRIRAVIKEGDFLALPKHSDKLIGDINCKVVSVSEDGKQLKLIPTNSIARLPLDAWEYGKEIATGKYSSDPEIKYYKLGDGTDVSQHRFVFVEHTSFIAGDDIEEDVFIEGKGHPGNPSVVQADGSASILHGSVAIDGSNLLQWLNANIETNWYRATSVFDRLDHKFNRAGFIFGFEDEDFKSLIKSVSIPSRDELEYAGTTIQAWITNASGVNYNASVFAPRGSGMETHKFPETLSGVIPVITLGV